VIRRSGPRTWNNIHVTKTVDIADLIDIDNASASGGQATGFDLLKQAAHDFDALVQEARYSGVQIRALGSSWALTDIAVTPGWLINTKLLNACFDVSDGFFDVSYPAAERPYVVVAQCGISIGELNVHLEVTATPGFPRALKTSGIGAGQTVAGSISGNTHGAAVNFGATPDYVVGIQLVTGQGKSLWLERASHPVMNADFVRQIDAVLLRDDDVFESAVVSFGAFGIIAAVAIETDPLYDLAFRKVQNVSHPVLKQTLDNFDSHDPPNLYHYEFVFDPYSKHPTAMVAVGTRETFQHEHPAPKPLWVLRDEHGYSPGDLTAKPFLQWLAPLGSAASLYQFERYRRQGILDNVRCTPGQAFMATITYLEGYNESAIGIPITHAAQTIEIMSQVIRRRGVLSIVQVRLVHPSRARLGFTSLAPKTCVFELGLANDGGFPRFENELVEALMRANVPFRLHWSKNSGIDRPRLEHMYGRERVDNWKAARARVFNNDTALMQIFENAHLLRAGLN
jgi:FAD/FMN-containing dehydrogenase